MASKQKKLDYEAAVKELETLVERLEQGDISLEESLKLYERGVLLTRDCQDSLKAAEQKVQMLLQQSGQSNMVDFDPESDPS
ncbi:exodeoxyribonuclease VII small subunit [Methylophaga sp. OBS1]|jgi:exodeoxyribonuclease VII small subunit|uniref:exodeoxyribonuclease VII small subunit n=1 Tax=Methylophaga sp. OBS1 TaxID=2991933 RepID=UPI0022565F3A|nr:exodeoxyribonuclease VII small subunit [Methylophaga sp. OBS1]MCX4193314.1 exodeoxyribonuclease VII small subunit [Methylophaga sp. OBS1]